MMTKIKTITGVSILWGCLCMFIQPSLSEPLNTEAIRDKLGRFFYPEQLGKDPDGASTCDQAIEYATKTQEQKDRFLYVLAMFDLGLKEGLNAGEIGLAKLINRDKSDLDYNEKPISCKSYRIKNKDRIDEFKFKILSDQNKILSQRVKELEELR